MKKLDTNRLYEIFGKENIEKFKNSHYVINELSGIKCYFHNYKLILNAILKFENTCNKYNFSFIDRIKSDILSISILLQKRHINLINNNKNTSIIDISKYLIFFNKKDAENLYNKMCKLKTSKMIKDNYNNKLNHLNSLEGFIYRHGNDIGKIKYEEYKKKRKSIANTNINYWISKNNGNIEQAKIEYYNRQSTFSLKKCIEKYGIDEGQKIFNNRQLKWQNSLKNKTTKEIELINKKKGTASANAILNFSDENKIGYFYIFDIKDNIFKIGITCKKFNRRYNKKDSDNTKNLILYEYNYKKCCYIEQIIKNKYINKLIDLKDKIEPFGFTECFYLKDKNEIMNEISKLITYDVKDLQKEYLKIILHS